jgi:hypothetical protein
MSRHIEIGLRQGNPEVALNCLIASLLCKVGFLGTMLPYIARALYMYILEADDQWKLDLKV